MPSLFEIYSPLSNDWQYVEIANPGRGLFTPPNIDEEIHVISCKEDDSNTSIHKTIIHNVSFEEDGSILLIDSNEIELLAEITHGEDPYQLKIKGKLLDYYGRVTHE